MGEEGSGVGDEKDSSDSVKVIGVTLGAKVTDRGEGVVLIPYIPGLMAAVDHGEHDVK